MRRTQDGKNCGQDGKKNVFCPPSDDCAKGGCYCQLFKRKKNSTDAVPWEVARTNHAKEVKYKPDEFDYKCLCVKPILEAEPKTIDGVKYAMRFVLCGLGTCSLDSVIKDPLDPKTKALKEIKCSGSCEGDCKCTLFRLRIRGDRFDPKEAKWEYMAKADQQIAHDDEYIYHCFCLK